MNSEEHTERSDMTETWDLDDEYALVLAVMKQPKAAVDEGLIDWDSVSNEIRSKRSLAEHLTTSDDCRRKYDELQTRCRKDSSFYRVSANVPAWRDVAVYVSSAVDDRNLEETMRLIDSQLEALRSKKKGKNDDEEDVVSLDGIEYVLLEQRRRVQLAEETEALREEYNDLLVRLAYQKEIVDTLEALADDANNASPQGPYEKDKGVEVAVEQMKNLQLKESGNI